MEQCAFCLNKDLWFLTDELYNSVNSELSKISPDWSLELIDMIDKPLFKANIDLEALNNLLSFRYANLEDYLSHSRELEKYELIVSTGWFSSKKNVLSICDSCNWWLDDATFLIYVAKRNQLLEKLNDNDGNINPDIADRLTKHEKKGYETYKTPYEDIPFDQLDKWADKEKEGKKLFLKNLIDNRDNKLPMMKELLIEYIELMEPQLKEFERLYLLYFRDLHKKIVEVLTENKIKMGVNELESRINLYGDVKVIREVAEKLFIKKSIKRTGNNRYYI